LKRAILALGSNLGDRAGHLRAAVGALPDVEACSGVYETEPVGGPEDQGPYLNMAVRLATELSPPELLAVCHEVEEQRGRERIVHWGPRTLDCDIIWMDGIELDEPGLHVPHPRFRERAFVLAPLAEVAPDLVPADWESAFPDGTGVWRLGALEEVA
jgi:2-amino-4-hydroxy-6-hydroxymethyldihydropteridine diphosphokinase